MVNCDRLKLWLESVTGFQKCVLRCSTLPFVVTVKNISAVWQRGSDLPLRRTGMVRMTTTKGKRELPQGKRIKKSGVILNGAAARAKAAGRCAVKDPVESWNDLRPCLNPISALTGSFDSAPPRLCPRGAPLRMTAILMRLP